MMAIQPSSDDDDDGDGGGGMAALGELICRLNPYTELPLDATTGEQTGKMEVRMLPPASVSTKLRGSSNPRIASITSIAIEVERNYGSNWTFKGQAQTVRTAFRIPYRFAVKDKDGRTLYWQTEHLLIGYAGAEGGG
jgi:hypothetical protein